MRPLGAASLAVLVAAVAVVLLVPSSGSAAGVAYVDAGSGACSDARSFDQAGSPGSPWCSLARAVEAAPGGAIVEVRAGSYPRLTVDGDGRTSTLSLRAYAGERPAIAGVELRTSHLRLEGFRLTDQSLVQEGSHDLQLVRNELSPAGLQVFSPKDMLIEGNHFHGIVLEAGASAPSGYALWVNSGSNDAALCCDGSGLVIRGNRFEDVENDAIQLGGGANDVVIEANRFLRIQPTNGAHGDPIQLVGAARTIIRSNHISESASGLMLVHSDNRGAVIENNVITGVGWACDCGHMPGSRFLNNTFWGNEFGGILLVDDQLENQPATTGVVIQNNILQSISTDSSATPHATMIAALDYNLVPNAAAKDGPHDVVGPPRFVAAGDFQLGAGSPAIDAGTSEGAPARDMRGYLRVDDPATTDRGGGSPRWYDIGALELGAVPDGAGGRAGAPARVQAAAGRAARGCECGSSGPSRAGPSAASCGSVFA